MSQFMVNKQVVMQNQKVKVSASGLNNNTKDVDKGEIVDCRTTDAYKDRSNDIKKLITLYSDLVVKDANDIDKFVFSSMSMDVAIAKLIK